jgi:uncharacterized membrane protein YjfL (UPF0719 family)
MELLMNYATALGWVVCFLILAVLARVAFDLITPFTLKDASAQKNAAVGRVLRGLYLGLAILLVAAIHSSHSLLAALRDGAVGVALMLIMFKVYDLVDRRDFNQELVAGNNMLAMELEGLFILLAAVIVGAMNYLG